MQQKPIAPNVAAICCFLSALLLYGITRAPTFGWGDSADLAMRMVYHGDTTFIGSSRDYVLYRWVGAWFQHLPLGDVGARANSMTAFFGAVTVGIVAFITGYVTRDRVAALAAGVALTVSHTFWLMSVVAEVYTFNAALVFGCYALLAVWWRTQQQAYLVAIALLAGLALMHHATGLVLAATLAPLILVRIRHVSWHWLLLSLAVYAASSAFYWQRTWTRLQADQPLLKALGLQTPTNLLFDVSPLHELLKFIAYVGYNYFGLAALLMLWGIATLWRNRVWEMLPPLLWFGLMVFAGITSSIPDKFNIYVLVYPVLAIAVGVGAAQCYTRWLQPKRGALFALLAALAIVPPLGYVASIMAAQRLSIDLVGARTMPYRDNNWYFMWPAKYGDWGPRQYAEEALQNVAPHALLIADYSLWRTLYLLQAVEGARPDVTVQWVEPLMWRGTVLQAIDAWPCAQPVYLATDTPAAYYQIDAVRAQHTLTPEGVVFRVSRSTGHCRVE